MIKILSNGVGATVQVRNTHADPFNVVNVAVAELARGKRLRRRPRCLVRPMYRCEIGHGRPSEMQRICTSVVFLSASRTKGQLSGMATLVL